MRRTYEGTSLTMVESHSLATLAQTSFHTGDTRALTRNCLSISDAENLALKLLKQSWTCGGLYSALSGSSAPERNVSKQKTTQQTLDSASVR